MRTIKYFKWIKAGLLGLMLCGANLEAQETTKTNVFEFRGGELVEFAAQVKTQLGFDLLANATIEDRFVRLRIPKMTLRYGDWRILLRDYNALSDSAEGALGRWVVSGAGAPFKADPLQAILFVPPNRALAKPQVRAFSIDVLKEEERTLLIQSVKEEAARLVQMTQDASDEYQGTLRYNSGTRLLLVTGGPGFMELATTMINAYREQQEKKKVF